MDKLIIGCGYLGVRIAARWREEHHRVFVTTRKPEKAAMLAGQAYRPIICDILDPASLRKLPAVDVAVHAIGLDRSAGSTMRQVYVDGLAHALDALPRPGRFVYVSSTSVYGQTAGETVDEQSSTEPLEPSGQVVLEAERLLKSRLDN